MSIATNPFIGELRLTSFNFAPKGWALCNGQLLPISQNVALFSLIGVHYGGDGITTFRLPDLRGRQALHQDQGNYLMGIAAGREAVSLRAAEVPTELVSDSEMTTRHPAHGAALAVGGAYATSATAGYMTSVGGGQPHENRPPYLVLNWIIALEGIFPSRP